MDERVRYRVIGALVIGSFILLISPIMLKKRAQMRQNHQQYSYYHPKSPVNHQNQQQKIVENWKKPLPIAHVALDKKPAVKNNVFDNERVSELPLSRVALKPQPAKIKRDSQVASLNQVASHLNPINQPKKAKPDDSSVKAAEKKSSVTPTVVQKKVSETTKAKPAKTLQVVKKTKIKPTINKKAPKKQMSKAVKPAYTVRVGAFSQPKNAQVLKKRLQGLGYHAFVEAVTKSKNQQLSIVFVGQVENRLKAEKLKKQLSVKTKLKGLVVKK